MATLPVLSAAEMRAAEALLARAWGSGASVRTAEPIWDRSHVVRLHLDTDRSVVMKKRADDDTFVVELAALEYLNGMPEPVAPRLLGADADAGIVLMEDLGPGASLADSLLTGDRSRVRADLVSYAGALGSMHAWSMQRPGPRPALGAWIMAWGDAITRALEEDSEWGTTTMRPRLLTWLRSFMSASDTSGVLPGLRGLASNLHEQLSARWPETVIADYPALAPPGAARVHVPDFWQPQV